MAHKLNNIHSHLQKQLALCHKHIGISESSFNVYNYLCVISLNTYMFCKLNQTFSSNLITFNLPLGHLCNDAEDNRQTEAFETLVHLFETSHDDNLKFLKGLLCCKDDQLPLVDGSTKKRVRPQSKI